MTATHCSVGRAASLVLACSATLALAACGNNPFGPDGARISARSIAITGPAALAHPGEAGQLAVMATFPDGTSRDVTSEVGWTNPSGVVTVTAQGVVTAARYGTATIVADYNGARATHRIRVAPPGAWLVQGHVASAAGVGLPDARVEFSSQIGSVTGSTNAAGGFELPAAGALTIQVEMEGFQTLVRQLMVDADGRTDDFVMAPVPVEGATSGSYRLTLTAAPSCVVPSDLRQRTYDAEIVEVLSRLFVRLFGADFVAWGNEAGFTGSRNGRSVGFVVSDDIWGDEYVLIERIAPGRDFSVSGTAAGSVEDGGIVAMLSGRLSLNGATVCTATDHRLEFTARDR